MQSVTLVEYQHSWALQFNEVAAELATVFEAIPVDIEHIGSTSVPGLCAKPVLDVLLGARTLDAVMSRAEKLAWFGYAYRAEYEVEIPTRRYFVRAEGTHLRVHLHAVIRGGDLWLRHIAFREALLQSSRLVREYASLKTHLAELHCHDKVAYTEAKAPFIRQVLAGYPASVPVAMPSAA